MANFLHIGSAAAFWRTLTWLARLDIAASITIAAVLLIWMAWR